MLAQTLASQAYHALNRVCVGQGRRVRDTRRGGCLCSLEHKRNNTGLRFVLQKPDQGNQGYLIWKDDHLPYQKPEQEGSPQNTDLPLTA